MGCGPSKTLIQPTSRIEISLRESELPAINELFSPAKSPTDLLYQNQNQLKFQLVDFYQHTGLNPTNCKLLDGITAMLYCLSACTSGDLKKLGLEVDSQYPYISVALDQLKPKVEGIYKAWNDLLLLVVKVNTDLNLIGGQIDGLFAQIQNLQMRSKEIITNSHISPEESSSALRVVRHNLNFIRRSREVLIDFSEEVNEIQVTLARLPNFFTSTSSQIREIGRICGEAKIFDPTTIVEKYWTPNQSINLYKILLPLRILYNIPCSLLSNLNILNPHFTHASFKQYPRPNLLIRNPAVPQYYFSHCFIFCYFSSDDFCLQRICVEDCGSHACNFPVYWSCVSYYLG